MRARWVTTSCACLVHRCSSWAYICSLFCCVHVGALIKRGDAARRRRGSIMGARSSYAERRGVSLLVQTDKTYGWLMINFQRPSQTAVFCLALCPLDLSASRAARLTLKHCGDGGGDGNRVNKIIFLYTEGSTHISTRNAILYVLHSVRASSPHSSSRYSRACACCHLAAGAAR